MKLKHNILVLFIYMLTYVMFFLFFIKNKNIVTMYAILFYTIGT